MDAQKLNQDRKSHYLRGVYFLPFVLQNNKNTCYFLFSRSYQSGVVNVQDQWDVLKNSIMAQKYRGDLTQGPVEMVTAIPHECFVLLPWNSVQFSWVTQLCLTLCDPMDCSTPGLPVHHQLPEPTQTHVHWVSDVIQPSHPLLSPSPLTFNLSQHQGLFQWVSSSHQVAKIWEFQPQHQSFQWIFRMDFL